MAQPETIKRFSAAPYHAVTFLFNNRKFHDYLCIGFFAGTYGAPLLCPSCGKAI